MTERFVDAVDLSREEVAALQVSQGRKSGIVGEQRTEFLPGKVRTDVGEVAAGELAAAETKCLSLGLS